jgi:RsiW-degrading membrane proteinase PrsW (M82 family)
MIGFSGTPMMIWLLPPALVFFLLFNHERKESGEQWLLAKVFLLGIALVIPAYLLEAIFIRYLATINVWPIISLLIESFLAIAVVEESLKYGLFLALCKKWRKSSRSLYLGLAIAVCLSLGFSLTENIRYLDQETGILWLRACTALPMHLGAAASFALLSARRARLGKGLAWVDVGLAYLLHGLYDFVLLLGGGWRYCAIPLAMGSAFFVIYCFVLARKEINARGK